MDSRELLSVENLGKKYCRSLRRSMYYGLTDIGRELLGKELHTETLRKNEFWALQDVSFNVNAGECLGIIGANGCGKSTLLKIIGGILLPDNGQIRVNGRIGSLIEIGAGFHPLLSGRENIYLQGAILGLSAAETRARFDEIVDFSGLENFIDMPVKNYSSGMYVRLGFAIAAQLNPDLLLIDEILAVGDIRFRVKCIEHMNKLQRDGTSIILVSHNMIDVLKTTEECIVMDKGVIHYKGETQHAVETYYSLMHSCSKNHENYNNNGVMVKSVAAFNAEGIETRKFRTGENIQFDIEIESDQSLENARIIFAVEKPYFGNISSISNAYQGKVINLSKGTNRIGLVLESVPFLKGHYLINISMYGKDNSEFFFRILGISSFEITEPDLDYSGFGISGSVNLTHHWNISGNC